MKKIAILRGINVGGKRKILMKDLRVLFEKLDYTTVSTYIQSGNVFFESDSALTDLEIASQVEQAITNQYGFDVPVIIRSSKEIAKVANNNPFLQQKETDITQLHLTFLKELPTSENLSKINAYNYEPDQFVMEGKNAFIFCEGKYHKSKLTNSFFEKKLKVTATTRNWKTVLKLLELSQP